MSTDPDSPQKLFRLPGTIEEEEPSSTEQPANRNGSRAESPLLSQRSSTILPRNVTLLRVSTHSSSIAGGVHRQDSVRSRQRAGPQPRLRRRAVLKSGECNVLRSRMSRRSLRFLRDIFTTLVDSRWRWTLLCFALSFVLSWLGFAGIWWLIAFSHGDLEPRRAHDPDWAPCVAALHSFASCFLFSIETQHTIGYGGRATTEECPEAIFVMCAQSIAGMMIQAFMVGIVFAKMSRPRQRTQTLLFSRRAVVCQRDGELCLMFRVGDMRKSHIVGASVRAQLIRSRTTREGEVLAHCQRELRLGADDARAHDLFFIWPTTIVHRIDERSPFYDMSAGDVLRERFEVVVVLEGAIESTGMTTQARSSYLPSEILWGHRFRPMVGYCLERQGYHVDYSFFNSTVQVDTPLCSGRELAEFYRLRDESRRRAPDAEFLRKVPTNGSLADGLSMSMPSPPLQPSVNGQHAITGVYPMIQDPDPQCSTNCSLSSQPISYTTRPTRPRRARRPRNNATTILECHSLSASRGTIFGQAQRQRGDTRHSWHTTTPTNNDSSQPQLREILVHRVPSESSSCNGRSSSEGSSVLPRPTFTDL